MKQVSLAVHGLVFSFKEPLDQTLPPAGDSRSPGVSPPPALQAVKTRLPRACLTRHLPPSGIPTLVTAFFLHNPRALFHALRAHGVLPPRLFPFAEPSGPLEPGCPPAVSHQQPRTEAGCLVYRALLPTKIRHLQVRVYPILQAAALLAFLPSRDFPPAEPAPISRNLPS